ncbi:MAG: amino acid carrier protein [Myxococcales bacterium]|nr:amino acid carrier protein [Myxococcales bacterium]
MADFFEILDAINGVVWADAVLYLVLGVGVLFTLWSGFSQYRALTHGVAVVRGVYDDDHDPGAISHFQALSAALSATVGLGNIGGVAVAIALGGPGAVFWMWMIGLAGMALKLTEVGQAMLFRNTDDPDNPHGGPMWVAKKGMEDLGYGAAGKLVGGLFCLTLMVSTITGGNMFQAWNVGIVTRNATGGAVPTVVTGMLLAMIVGAVILGGIQRIGAVAGRLVPFMCALYLLAAGYVLVTHITAVPAALGLIVSHAFSAVDAQGAFVGGTAGYAFLWGMKRALFSSEAGQGSAPIAHAAAKTNEPVREAVVAGLEPFIDTLVVCTITSLVILLTGAWNRAPEANFGEAPPVFTQTVDGWSLGVTSLPERTAEAARVARGDFDVGGQVFVVVRHGAMQEDTGTDVHRVMGRIEQGGQDLQVVWEPVDSASAPVLVDGGVHVEYPGAALTSHAFDRALPGLGTWLVLIASWLFAISTMISWSYYGEQGIVYLFGKGLVLPYRGVYCLCIVVATLPFIETDAQLDALTSLGTGVMLWANIPIMLMFGPRMMKAYHDYMRRLDAGEFERAS